MASRASIKGKGVDILFGGGERPVPEEVPETSPPPEEEVAVLERIGRRRPLELASEIDELYKIIVAELSTREKLAEKALSLLQEARDTLLEDPRNYDVAELKVHQARTILQRVRDSRTWGSTYGVRLLAYELAWLAVLLALLIFEKPIAVGLSSLWQVTSTITGMTMLFPMWTTMLWGGIGGVVGALYSLHWHVSVLQDFDKNHWMYYVVHPIMGIILGGIIYLIASAGFLAMGADVTRLNEEQLRWLPALIACLAGFRQKFAYELLDRIMEVLGRKPEV
ncbi:MAG: hypothetical protein RMK30_07805 [Anaerolineae bacterium]|nr:hypothetical protein [Anaerolineae bacterium]MDW8102764.1 hypothetical protein [Anaerolineae bacterium]